MPNPFVACYLPSDLKIFEKLRDSHSEIILNFGEQCKNLKLGETIPEIGINLDLFNGFLLLLLKCNKKKNKK